MTEEEFVTRQGQLVHALQSGVAYDLTQDDRSGQPKHLRVGVNMALVESGALAALLLEKGVFSQEEYRAALIAGMEAEVERYEKLLGERYGTKVTLG